MPNRLMTMSTVDPIKVYFRISEQDYLKVAKRSRGNPGGRWSRRPRSKSFSPMVRCTDIQESSRPSTVRWTSKPAPSGSLRLFPNPANILRPGGFVRVRVTVRKFQGALLVPQRAVNELQTSYEVAVVGGDNKVEIDRSTWATG